MPVTTKPGARGHAPMLNAWLATSEARCSLVARIAR
jgi:hypothetical protein